MASHHAGPPDDRLVSGRRLRELGIALLLGASGFLMISVGIVGYVIGVPLLITAYVILSEDDWSFVDISLPAWRDIGYIIGGTVLLLAALIGISQLFALLGTSTAEHGLEETASQNPTLLLYMIPVALLVIGPGEELLYRNLVQKRLYTAFSGQAAVLIASVIFAMFHYQAYATGSGIEIAASLVTVFALSVLLGGIYLRTQNILVPALVHGLYNAFQFVILYIEVSGGTPV